MSTPAKFLVTSAAGKTGTHVTRQLLEKGHPVRAFVRRRDARSDALRKAGAEIFVGNQYSLTDMRAAMEGVKRAYQCTPTAPNGMQFMAIFTVAANEAELERRASNDDSEVRSDLRGRAKQLRSVCARSAGLARRRLRLRSAPRRRRGK